MPSPPRPDHCPLILASGSPRRAALLRQIGLSFTQHPTATDETDRRGEAPRDYVTRLAAAKAMNAAAAFATACGNGDGIVIGADTTVVHNGRIFGKPAHRDEAIAMLRALSGDRHETLTAVCLLRGTERREVLSRSVLRFRDLSLTEITGYVDTGEPLDKAGAYAIQGRGAVFISQLSGSYSGVMGLPLCETAVALAELGCPLPLAPRR